MAVCVQGANPSLTLTKPHPPPSNPPLTLTKPHQPPSNPPLKPLTKPHPPPSNPSLTLKKPHPPPSNPSLTLTKPHPPPAPSLTLTKPHTTQQPACAPGTVRWVEGLPTLYIITPTYPRAEQMPEITRTAQTLLNVPNVVWLVSEDAPTPTPALTAYLNHSALTSVYMRVQMPSKYIKAKNKPRGVANRVAGLDWVRRNARTGVLYFADDDNTYDLRIFEQMRWTQKVSMFPVGLVTNLGVSTPIVRAGKVVGFYDGWIARRKFPVDMAGFAVSVAFLLSLPNATMPFTVGYEEDGFIKSLGITAADIEPLAFNCTKVVFGSGTPSKKNAAALPVAQNNVTIGSNLDIIKDLLWKGGTSAVKKVAKVIPKSWLLLPCHGCVFCLLCVSLRATWTPNHWATIGPSLCQDGAAHVNKPAAYTRHGHTLSPAPLALLRETYHPPGLWKQLGNIACKQSFRQYCGSEKRGKVRVGAGLHLGRPPWQAHKSLLARLRKKTGFSISNCKKALELHADDVDKAESWLRAEAQAQGWEKATKLSGRRTAQGLVGIHIEGQSGAMVEVNCETDFVARNEKFRAMVAEVAREVLEQAASRPAHTQQDIVKESFSGEQLCAMPACDAKTLGDKVALAIGTIGENMSLARATRISVGADTRLVGQCHPSTVHQEAPLGRYGAIMALTSPGPLTEVARQLCVHVIGECVSAVGM
ncbi:Galactosylgalactosylxylosylprotein 3-beta-glucuronosyltransferase P [Chionoecetes opilio]|uniref:Elongation factor Ts, mitochondrial n=1 Tax=Chionoecetes opilio TaxID=41210 RepID=A0A8J5D1W2_CHIOP|nr:Galactosylgalactosylxylosylprotein 3-beta-glucuronosyltransferase P [Chionoecetes opilio]